MSVSKIVSWNVNGIRAAIKKGFRDVVTELDADVFCVQETKARPEQVELELSGYSAHWHWAEKKGYSGVLILSKEEPLSVQRGLGKFREDTEGRVIAAEYEELWVVSVYTPNAKRDLSRLEDRQGWDAAFLRYVKLLEESKPVVFCGDLNVAHEEIDLARPKQNKKTHGFTLEERAGFTRLVEAGLIDTFREFEPGGGHYSWWAVWGNNRASNVGWRIDYVMVSEALRPRLVSATIYKDIHGSDHCPVGIELS
jgi:exodeoxyribonuclease III